MDQQRFTIENVMRVALEEWLETIVTKADDSGWWKCVLLITLPFWLVALSELFLLFPLLVCLRLAITNADRVVFVVASAILSFYGVPHKVFYIYITVLAVTGFLQFLRYRSTFRSLFLGFLSWISRGTSNRFLRKFTTLHFTNPFNRCFTLSQVIYVPLGLEVPLNGDIEIFDFRVSEHLDFDKMVRNCRIIIETVDKGADNNTIRSLYVEAPWGDTRLVVSMENDNLGRLICYFNRIIETNCKELICTPVSGVYEALSIVGAVEHFNSGLPLVKLDLHSKKDVYAVH